MIACQVVAEEEGWVGGGGRLIPPGAAPSQDEGERAHCSVSGETLTAPAGFSFGVLRGRSS